ncbi:MAG: hypothetical protein WAN36_11575 [Calditrichia bacterium]
MSRSRKSNDPPLSLFPMFNILICTLGVLIFILITVVILSIGINKQVIVSPEIPSGAEKQKKPLYVEWTGSALIIHPEETRIPLPLQEKNFNNYKDVYHFIEQSLNSSTSLTSLKEVYRHGSDRYLLILIRPSGFQNFDIIRGYFEQKKIDIGYEPIEQNWELYLKEKDNAAKVG